LEKTGRRVLGASGKHKNYERAWAFYTGRPRYLGTQIPVRVSGYFSRIGDLLCYLRSGAAVKRAAFIFWLSLGLAVMMKGPITPVIILTGLLALFIWERNGAWMKPLISPFGIVAFIIIVAPWTWLIWEKTGGDFFTVAVSEDLAPKMSGQSENHGGPVGYYLLTVWAMFWPGTAFLLAGLSLALRSARNARKAKKAGRDIPQAMPRAARLLLCWAVPWWIIVEIAPTKLPHYTLPVYSLRHGNSLPARSSLRPLLPALF